MTPDKVEEIVDFIAESKLSRMETAEKVRIMLTQHLMSEVEKARDQEAKLWFETWYSHYIAPEKPLPEEFANFATERIQMTGYLRDEAQTIIKSK